MVSLSPYFSIPCVLRKAYARAICPTPSDIRRNVCAFKFETFAVCEPEDRTVHDSSLLVGEGVSKDGDGLCFFVVEAEVDGVNCVEILFLAGLWLKYTHCLAEVIQPPSIC